MSAEENKAIFIHFVDELRKGNIGIIDEVCSPNFAFYSPTHSGWPRGLAGARQLITIANSVASDRQIVIEDIFAEADKVAVRWTIRGTYNGEPRPGYPKPGEQFTQGMISIYRFANGKIEEDWGLEAFSPSALAWS